MPSFVHAAFTPALAAISSSLALIAVAALVGVALTLWLTMTWFGTPPQAEADPSADGTDGDDGGGGGGGGGGLRPTEDPPRAPGPDDGINWDDFDREREAWESLREPVRALTDS